MANREILSMHIGGSGINMGHHMWDQFITEHGINSDGTKSSNNDFLKDYIFFDELKTKAKKFKPRSLFIDSDVDKINEIANSPNSKLFDDQYVHFQGSNVTLFDKMRNTLESYDNFQGFMFYRSASGKISTQFSRVLSKIKEVFGKNKVFCEYMTYPSTSEYAQNPNALSNTLLNLYNASGEIDVSFMLDNEQIRLLTERFLKSYIVCPNGYYSINEYIAKLISGTTVTLRSSKSYTGLRIKNMDQLSQYLCRGGNISYRGYCTASFVPIEPKNDYLSTCEAKKRILVDAFCRDSAPNSYISHISPDINEIICERFYGMFEPYKLMKNLNNEKYQKCRTDLRKLLFLSFMEKHLSLRNVGNYDFEESKWSAQHLNVRGNVKAIDISSAVNRMKGFMYHSQTHGSTAERKDSKCIIKEQKIDCTMMGSANITARFLRKRVLDACNKSNSRLKFYKDDEELLAYQSLAQFYDRHFID